MGKKRDWRKINREATLAIGGKAREKLARAKEPLVLGKLFLEPGGGRSIGHCLGFYKFGIFQGESFGGRQERLHLPRPHCTPFNFLLPQ